MYGQDEHGIAYGTRVLTRSHLRANSGLETTSGSRFSTSARRTESDWTGPSSSGVKSLEIAYGRQEGSRSGSAGCYVLAVLAGWVMGKSQPAAVEPR
jgi:hypothetical protein